MLFPARPESRSPARVLALGDLGCVSSSITSGQLSPFLRPPRHLAPNRGRRGGCPLPTRRAGSLCKKRRRAGLVVSSSGGQSDPSRSCRITHNHQMHHRPLVYDSWEDSISVCAGRIHFLSSILKWKTRVRCWRIHFTGRQFGWQEWDVNDVEKLGNDNSKQQIVHTELLCSRHGPKDFFIKQHV